MFKVRYCAVILAALALVFVAAVTPGAAEEATAVYKMSDPAQVLNQKNDDKINEATVSSTSGGPKDTSLISYSQRKADVNEKKDTSASDATHDGTFVMESK